MSEQREMSYNPALADAFRKACHKEFRKAFVKAYGPAFAKEFGKAYGEWPGESEATFDDLSDVACSKAAAKALNRARRKARLKTFGKTPSENFHKVYEEELEQTYYMMLGEATDLEKACLDACKKAIEQAYPYTSVVACRQTRLRRRKLEKRGPQKKKRRSEIEAELA